MTSAPAGEPALCLTYCVIYAANLPALTRFYHETLGFPIAEQNDRFVAFGGAGAPLALERGGPVSVGPRSKVQNPVLLQFTVTSIETIMTALQERGVVFDGVIRRGHFGALAFFHDPEGNRLALLAPAHSDQP